jgi:DNA-binding transcriptional LysR family regulator
MAHQARSPCGKSWCSKSIGVRSFRVHIELRHLRYFLAVAEELNFSRAAERLHIAQPALSAQIRALENQLGCELFVRTTRRVALTANGRLLQEEARAIVERTDEGIARIEAAVRGERGKLRVGFFVHGAGEIGTEIMLRFAERFPSVEAEMVNAPTLEETQRQVWDQQTDVAFVWLPLHFSRLEFELLVSEELFIAISPDHRFASRGAVTVWDLEHEPVVVPWEQSPEELLAYWLEPFRPKGRRQANDPNGKDHDECLLIAGQGIAAYTVPGSVTRFNPRPDVVYRPVAGAPPKENGIAWHPDTRNAAVASFLTVAREVRDRVATRSAIQSSGS